MKKPFAIYIYIYFLTLNFFTLPILHASEERICLKTGRQFYISLANYLDLDRNLSDYKIKFVELSHNLPKHGYMSEFDPSLASLVQMSDKICIDYANAVAPIPDENLSMKYQTGDTKIISDLINDSIITTRFSIQKAYLEDTDRYYFSENKIINEKVIEEVCFYYLEQIRRYYNPNYKIEYAEYSVFDWRNYCSDIAPSIYKIFDDRGKKRKALQQQKFMNLRRTKFLNLINPIYIKILNRPANTTEIESLNNVAITNENQMAYLACVSAAASLEFLSNDQRCD